METANLLVRITSDGKGLSQGITGAVNQFKGMQQAIAGGVLATLVKRQIDAAGALADLAAKTGVSTDALQAWQYAAKQNGASVDDLAKAFRGLQKASVEAVGGDAKTLAAFGRLGIDINKIKSTNPEKLFEDVAAAFEKLPPSAQATSDALILMGKSGDSVLPAMRDGFKALADEARKTGQVIDSETIAKLDAVGDKMSQLEGRFSSLMAPAVGFLATQARNTMDLVESAVAYPSAVAGALSAGSKLSDASNAGWDAVRKVVDTRIKDDSSLTEKAIKLKTGSTISIGATPRVDTSKEVGKTSLAGFKAPVTESDQLSKIGLFRGGSADTTPLLRQQVSRLESVVRELQGIKAELQSDD